ncbi:ArnT family glycosyltransferase [Winogradskyella thalassocola]|uniref:Dolichyl-phosphate-mannose-protein mannosyltransferase n=1 Tax=Winogradskyella thalassocola TaxID=262004 RepID=A0A1G8D496_9FLAO|nr:glycosyltransferase family 39 protein [Winogradskyella thalassocola]SDH52334.1 Dolichyl-phosphate-mannose-protein mannosyltransferase [Winogradskyella thalassocola]
MKKYLPILLVLSIVKLTIQWFGNKNYGFHRDELLHLSASEHLDWGYMEFPPFIAFIGKMAYLLFDYSLLGVRLFPTLAGVTILVLCGLMVKELGGKSKAIVLAGICILAFLPFYRNHTLFQPVAFNQLFWTLGFYFVIKFINTQNKNFLMLLGITLGLGLMNKYTILVWAFGLFIGLFFYEKGKVFKNKWLYISAVMALLIALPNIIWQLQNDVPLLQHLQALNKSQLDDINPMEFGLAQLDYPFTLIISLFGVFALIAGKNLKKYRAVGIAVVVIFTTMWLLQSKAYYVFAMYPVLFAAGAVKIEALLVKKPFWVYAIAIVTLLPSIYFIPELTPILPIDSYVKYAQKEELNGRVELTGDYADMFGWEEQVKLVDSVYQSLSAKEQNNCVLWAENYGEAGALKILGHQYNLPNPISRHGSFWTWGYGNKDADVWISLGNEKPSVESVFEDVQLVKIITHKYAIGEENGIPLYICRKPKIDIEKWWKDYEPHIFD